MHLCHGTERIASGGRLYKQNLETNLRRIPLIVASALGLIVATPAASQTFLVDLSVHTAGTSSQIAVAPGSSGVVEIISLVPTKKYSITTRVRVIPIEPLTNPFAGAGGGGTDLCVEADTSRLVEGALRAVFTENEVATRIDQMLSDAGACVGNAQRIVELVRERSRRLTRREVRQVTLNAGEELEVRVVREDNQIWTVIFSPGPRGAWHALYGFMFTPRRDETYFANPEGDKFRVAHDFTSQKELVFTPSVFWSWMPASRDGRNFNFGPTAGVGFDKANPAVFAGLTLTFNHNIGFVAGAVAQRQKRLAANYDPGSLPLVASALTPDQLSRETYRPNVFVGVVFRFNSSPFAAPKEKDKDGDKAGEAKPTPKEKG
jgi:hypothetical protein